MAVRIVGVDLPQNKQGQISLTYIYGIGRSAARTILAKAGIDPAKKVQDWTDDEAAKVREEQAKAQTAKAGGYTVTGEGDPAIDALVLARGEAKKAKNFAEADRIRDELKAMGVEVTDVPGGASWKKV